MQAQIAPKRKRKGISVSLTPDKHPQSQSQPHSQIQPILPNPNPNPIFNNLNATPITISGNHPPSATPNNNSQIILQQSYIKFDEPKSSYYNYNRPSRIMSSSVDHPSVDRPSVNHPNIKFSYSNASQSKQQQIKESEALDQQLYILRKQIQNTKVSVNTLTQLNNNSYKHNSNISNSATGINNNSGNSGNSGIQSSRVVNVFSNEHYKKRQKQIEQSQQQKQRQGINSSAQNYNYQPITLAPQPKITQFTTRNQSKQIRTSIPIIQTTPMRVPISISTNQSHNLAPIQNQTAHNNNMISTPISHLQYSNSNKIPNQIQIPTLIQASSPSPIIFNTIPNNNNINNNNNNNNNISTNNLNPEIKSIVNSNQTMLTKQAFRKDKDNKNIKQITTVNANINNNINNEQNNSSSNKKILNNQVQKQKQKNVVVPVRQQLQVIQQSNNINVQQQQQFDNKAKKQAKLQRLRWAQQKLIDIIKVCDHGL